MRTGFLQALIVILGVSGPAFAEEPAVIVAHGQGTVRAAPDMAEVVVGVQSRAASARAALDQNNAAMTKLMAALKKAGVADTDLRTSRFAVAPYYASKEGTTARRPSGYQVVNRITVRVHALDRLGALLDTAVSAGGNDIEGVRFMVSAPGALLDKARQKAVDDAFHRAGLLAQAAGIRLGSVLRIDELGTQPPRPMMMAAGAASRAVPVAPGEQEVRAQVMIRFGIE